MKLYTAIGAKKDSSGENFSVWVGQEEKHLAGMEIYIWSALLWTFCEEEKIYGRVEKMVWMALGEEKTRQKITREEYGFCFQRLCDRGLVACCEGKGAEEAVMGLMRAAVMEPSRISAGERLTAFKESMKSGRGIWFSLRAFHTMPLEKGERELLVQIQQTGDIAYHLEILSNQVDNRFFLLKDTDMQGRVRETMQKEFLAGVIALYGKKILNIRSLCREAYC